MRFVSERPELPVRLAVLALGLATLGASVWSGNRKTPSSFSRSPLRCKRFHTLFATIRPVTDYSVVVRNPNAGSGSRLFVRVRVTSGAVFTRILSPGESVAAETLLPARGPIADRVITDVAVMEQVLDRSHVEWCVIH